MKISSVGANRRSEKARSSSSNGGNDGVFAAALQSSAATGNVSKPEASGVFSVGAMLSMQEAQDATAESSRRALRRYADDVLDRLEDIRLSILTGAVSKEKLGELARILRARQERIEDPRLSAIIGEVELRAEVEIAKLARKP